MFKRSYVLLIMVSIMLIVSCNAQQAETKKESKIEKELEWMGNIEEALEIAKAEEKTVLVDFTGSDWCGWCIKLDNEVFSKKDFIEYAENNLVLVKLDFPKSVPQTDEVKRYNQIQQGKYGIRGFPTILLINKEGKVIAQTGYQRGGPVFYIEHLQAYIDKN